MKLLLPISSDEQEEINSQKEAAFSLILEAWNEALQEGIDLETFANAALFKAFSDLVSRYGEDAVADMVSNISQRIRIGEFSLQKRIH